jgi:hypothetical protein
MKYTVNPIEKRNASGVDCYRRLSHPKKLPNERWVTNCSPKDVTSYEKKFKKLRALEPAYGAKGDVVPGLVAIFVED